MDRDAVLDLLAPYVAARLLSQAEALALLSAWEGGAIGDEDLPAPLATTAALAGWLLAALAPAGAALREILRAAKRVARAPVSGALFSGLPLSLVPPDRVTVDGVGPADHARRRLLARDLLDTLDREIERRTALLFAPPDDAAPDRRSRGSLRRWQAALRQAHAEDLATLYRLGLGRPLTPAEEARLARLASAGARYVDGYGAALARQRAGLEEPDSPAQVAARLRRRLGGDVAGAFWRAEASTYGEGWVAHFRGYDAGPARGRSCSPCLEAERGGPYLPSEAPIPAETCRGGGFCRHRLDFAYDPAAYARLTTAQRLAA